VKGRGGSGTHTLTHISWQPTKIALLKNGRNCKSTGAQYIRRNTKVANVICRGPKRSWRGYGRESLGAEGARKSYYP